jgi:TPR repeat protein
MQNLHATTRCALALLLGLAASAVHAADCRAVLRPLLLSAAPATADIAAARTQCTAEAAAGSADAGFQLAFFSLGLGGEWSPDTAIPLIRAAADAGVSEAQYWLAWQAEEGPLLANDQATALGWYRLAAAANHRLALDRLARAYERGELGLTPDPREALRLRAQIRQCDDQGENRREDQRPVVTGQATLR